MDFWSRTGEGRNGAHFETSRGSGTASAGLVGLAALVASLGLGCGPSYDEHTIKTPAERLREQEEKAYRAEQARRNRPADDENYVDPDEPGAFDEKQAELELTRATRNAEECPQVVADHGLKLEKTAVTLTFAKDGSVAEVTIPPPYEDTRLGNCVLNAYRNFFVPPYNGDRHVMTWEVDLTKKAAQ